MRGSLAEAEGKLAHLVPAAGSEGAAVRTRSGDSDLLGLRFAVLAGIALIFGLAFAHVVELPGKLRLAGADWLTVQHNLYIGFGSVGSVVEPATFILAWFLTWRLRTRRGGFRSALFAALCVTAGLVEWALVVAPVNTALNNWTPETLPANWTAYRDRWEIGHAIHAGLFMAAFCLVFPWSAAGEQQISDGPGNDNPPAAG